MYDNFLVIGMTGEGKTSLVRRMVEDTNVFVFDVNDEWHDCSFDTRAKRARFIGDYEEYLILCMNRRNTNCIFEDATGFVSSNITKVFNKVMVKKRHNKNNYFFFFHSIADVPPAIARKMNYLILFKTGDEERVVSKKYERMYPAWKKVMSMPATPKDEGNKIVIQPHVKIKLL